MVTSWFPFSHQAVSKPGQPPIETGKNQPAATHASGMAAPPSASDVLELMLAKQAIQGIMWNQLSDAYPHQYPNAGLFGPNDEKRPLVDRWINLRREHLT
jgi:hypothetical protein